MTKILLPLDHVDRDNISKKYSTISYLFLYPFKGLAH